MKLSPYDCTIITLLYILSISINNIQLLNAVVVVGEENILQLILGNAQHCSINDWSDENRRQQVRCSHYVGTTIWITEWLDGNTDKQVIRYWILG